MSANGWRLYAPGELVRCPVCERPQDEVGFGTIVAVRKKANDGIGSPPPVLDRQCKGPCRSNLEVRLMIAAGSR